MCACCPEPILLFLSVPPSSPRWLGTLMQRDAVQGLEAHSRSTSLFVHNQIMNRVHGLENTRSRSCRQDNHGIVSRWSTVEVIIDEKAGSPAGCKPSYEPDTRSRCHSEPVWDRSEGLEDGAVLRCWCVLYRCLGSRYPTHQDTDLTRTNGCLRKDVLALHLS